MPQKLKGSDDIERVLLTPPDPIASPNKYHVCLKDGRCFFGRPHKVIASSRLCRFVCEYENSDRLIDIFLDEVEWIAVP